MVYGYFIKDTAGNERFFVEGCSYCNMSTGGQHESNCPCKEVKVKNTEKLNEAITKWLKANAGYSEIVWESGNIDSATQHNVGG